MIGFKKSFGCFVNYLNEFEIACFDLIMCGELYLGWVNLKARRLCLYTESCSVVNFLLVGVSHAIHTPWIWTVCNLIK